MGVLGYWGEPGRQQDWEVLGGTGAWGLLRCLGSAPGLESPITDTPVSHSEPLFLGSLPVFGVPQALQWPGQGAPVWLQVQLRRPDRLWRRERLLWGSPSPGFLHQERPEGEGTPTLPQKTLKTHQGTPKPPRTPQPGSSFAPPLAVHYKEWTEQGQLPNSLKPPKSPELPHFPLWCLPKSQLGGLGVPLSLSPLRP